MTGAISNVAYEGPARGTPADLCGSRSATLLTRGRDQASSNGPSQALISNVAYAGAFHDHLAVTAPAVTSNVAYEGALCGRVAATVRARRVREPGFSPPSIMPKIARPLPRLDNFSTWRICPNVSAFPTTNKGHLDTLISSPACLHRAFRMIGHELASILPVFPAPLSLTELKISPRFRQMKCRPISNPPNPWSSTEVDYLGEPPTGRLEVYEDQSREVLARNDSPDVGFSFSVNPYRGCMHACAYCYARPTHEYLSFGAGTDFDTKIAVKPNAASLLRRAFDRHSWKGELIVFSGVTDCYQPLEATLKLTRSCLEVCLDYRNPVGIITKAPLIERDIDLLQELARTVRLSVTISVPFWNQEHARE